MRYQDYLKLLCSFFKYLNLKYISLVLSFIFLYVVIYFWFLFQSNSLEIFIFDVLKFGNNYIYLGFDIVSLAFVSLTCFLIPFCIFFGYRRDIGLSQYSVLLSILGILLIYVFIVMDIFLFYILFESILIPLFIIIGLFGSKTKRLHSAFLLYGYTVFGSFLMLVVIFLFYVNVGSSFFLDLWLVEFSRQKEFFLFLLLFISFSIKIPLFPFHIWLPEAHVEASTEGSVILAGVLLKLGGYGIIRFILPVFGGSCVLFLPILYTLCIVGMFYVCLITLRQTDLKRIIAYSSIGHMSLVVMSLCTNNSYALDGSLYVMVSHGVISGALFFCVGYLYNKYRTRQMVYYNDLVQTMPVFCFLFFIFVLGNVAFPGLFSFVGELYMLMGVMSVSIVSVLLILPSLFLTTVFSIGIYSRIVFGYSGFLNSNMRVEKDCNCIDLLFFVPFVIVLVIWGIYPPSLLAFA